MKNTGQELIQAARQMLHFHSIFAKDFIPTAEAREGWFKELRNPEAVSRPPHHFRYTMRTHREKTYQVTASIPPEMLVKGANDLGFQTLNKYPYGAPVSMTVREVELFTE